MTDHTTNHASTTFHHAINRNLDHKTDRTSTRASTTTRPAPTTETSTRPVTNDGDHDRFAHFIRKADSTRAYVEGTPVEALCGKIWVPSRDPSRYPVCPTCNEIRKLLMKRGSN